MSLDSGIAVIYSNSAGKFSGSTSSSTSHGLDYCMALTQKPTKGSTATSIQGTYGACLEWGSNQIISTRVYLAMQSIYLLSVCQYDSTCQSQIGSGFYQVMGPPKANSGYATILPIASQGSNLPAITAESGGAIKFTLSSGTNVLAQLIRIV